MLVPQAIQDGFVAATNAVRGLTITHGDQASPIGSFTDLKVIWQAHQAEMDL